MRMERGDKDEKRRGEEKESKGRKTQSMLSRLLFQAHGI